MADQTPVVQLAREIDGGIVAKFSVSAMCQEVMVRDFIESASRLVAEKYVEEHYSEIAAKIDAAAVANLALAKAAKQIAEEEINARVRVETKTQREVYQRGIFGGISRIL